MEEELILKYTNDSEAEKIIEEMHTKNYLLVKHCTRTKNLNFIKTKKEPETKITEE